MAPSIKVQHLNYKFQDGSDGLKDVGLSLPSGSRTLLIGGLAPLTSYLESID
jgi:CCR4-NOT complex subunit CAF16